MFFVFFRVEFVSYFARVTAAALLSRGSRKRLFCCQSSESYVCATIVMLLTINTIVTLVQHTVKRDILV